MNTNALFKIEYGLYVLTAKLDDKDNGCIINTLMQLTSDPLQIAISVNKSNYTCEMIQKTKNFNLSVVSDDANFELFKRFGYQSGKDINKFDGFLNVKRSQNGILYITQNTNAYMSATVKQELDLKSHVLFVAQLDDCELLADKSTVTYDFYQKNIKPKPETVKTKGWRCKICNYIYEGENLPSDFICPICKHSIADFEKI